MADVLGISAEDIDVDHLESKNSKVASVVTQIDAILTLVSSVDTTASTSNEEKMTNASSALAQLIVDGSIDDNQSIDLVSNSNVSSSINTMIDKTAELSNITVSSAAKENVSSVTSQIVTKVKEISTDNNDVSTFANMEELRYNLL